MQPHHQGAFKLSSDTLFAEKVSDIIGLHIDPPLKAMALCVEKKSQIQALDRARPTLEKAPSLSKLRTHDYMRYGTTTLFAALKIRKNDETRDYFLSIRNTAFLRFLSAVESSVPEGMDVHLVMEDCCMPFLTKAWLAKRRCRFYVHFMPTAASWIKQVERWFALLSDKQIRRDLDRSTSQIEQAIREHIALQNDNPKPFYWTKPAAGVG